MKAKRKTTLIDANIILRMLLNDIPSQTAISQELFREIEKGHLIGKLSLLVIGEIIWAFEDFYEKPRSEFIPQIIKVISFKNIRILEIKKQDLMQILELMPKLNLDFTDLYLLYFSKQLKSDISTFDKGLRRNLNVI